MSVSARHAAMEAPVSLRASGHTNAAAPLDGQVNSASKLTPVPQTPVPTVASAPPLSLTTSVPAHPSSTAKPANKTSMNVPRARLPARMAACASTRSAGTDVSAQQSTRASTARAATYPATHLPATMEAPASRRETPAMNAPVCQVLQEKTATTTSTTVLVTSVKI